MSWVNWGAIVQARALSMFYLLFSIDVCLIVSEMASDRHLNRVWRYWY
jgi:hypothetical protein